MLPKDLAIAAIRRSIEKTYGRKSRKVVEKNFTAVDMALSHLTKIATSGEAHGSAPRSWVPESAPAFVRDVTVPMLAGRGDVLPVSAFPPDGSWPVGTSRFEKRNIADEIPVWDPATCIQCNKCVMVCPHAALRAKAVLAKQMEGAPASLKTVPFIGAEAKGERRYLLQAAPEDCTGCTLCVKACPCEGALAMSAKAPLLEAERAKFEAFLALPDIDRADIRLTMKGSQLVKPLFEFSGACAGCGQTPYVRTLTQLFGDRMLVANATGCSSIYSGNLPTTPYTVDADGRGPAWSNSLFEDNAEFGLGMRLAVDRHADEARALLQRLAGELPEALAAALLQPAAKGDAAIRARRMQVADLKRALDGRSDAASSRLMELADYFVGKVVWIIGGDGWAYDIGYGGLDHVLASGRNVNILVLDTEVYSNTGGQMSKSTPLGAVAKFAAAGKTVPKKDLALQAIAYGNVYVAKVAMGADPQQTLQAFREAEAYDGPSLVIGYSQCIAHGIDMRLGMDQQYRAVASGHWPLLRYDPVLRATGHNPFLLDSHRPRIPLADYVYRELRYRSLANADPVEAERLLGLAEQAIEQRWNTYEEMASRGPEHFHADARRER